MTRAQENFREKQIANLRAVVPYQRWSRVASLTSPDYLEEYFEAFDTRFDLYPELCKVLGVTPRPDLLIETQSGHIPAKNDLGLSALTDDQLLNLMEQGWFEIGSRTEQLWNLWMNTKDRVESEAKDRYEAWARGVQRAKEKRIAELQADVEKKMTAMAAAGQFKILTDEEEARCQFQGTLEAKRKIIEDFAAQLQAGTATKFLLEIEEGVISITSDGKTIEQPLIPIRADAFVAEVRKVVGV